MSSRKLDAHIQSIAIEEIHILNPRARNQKVFFEIVENIKKVGLKRPITVTLPSSKREGKEYDLVCGQGRIEAFQALGQKYIPAIIINESEEKVLLKSLIENLARRQHRPADHLVSVKSLLKKGYSAKTIAKKTGLDEAYAKMILELLEKGEERLLVSVMSGTLPISVAMQISISPEEEQRALHDAYEQNKLRGEKLRLVQRLLEARRQRGKGLRQNKYRINRSGKSKGMSAQDIMRIYQKEVDRKKLLTRKADQINRQMLFITNSIEQLLADQEFRSLLKSEGLRTMPKQLAALLDTAHG